MNKIQINKQRFLDWRFSDEDDLVYLGKLTLQKLNGGEDITIDSIWKETGYLPATLVCSGLDTSNVNEITPEDYEVEWL